MATLKVTEDQLRLIQRALDFYSRVGIGQFDVLKITQHLKDIYIKNLL